MAEFERDQKAILVSRLREKPRRLIIVTGPRQAGKTTMVQQALAEFRSRFVSADEPLSTFAGFGIPSTGELATGSTASLRQVKDERWLVREWETARSKLAESDSGFVLAVDEVQKIPNWSEIVKGMWDADRRLDLPLHVVLLGSAPLLIFRGMSESLAGRFETIHLSHWSYPEMSALAGLDLSQYVYFGGYPGAASLIHEEKLWRDHIIGSLIEPNIERDILAMERVDKPALLRNLFELAAPHSGQILSYTKMLGALHDAGNTTTLARYLELLNNAELVTGLPKYSGSVFRRRASTPKIIVRNTALMSALSHYSFKEAVLDRTFWGRIVESAVGAHLLNTASTGTKVYYWREKNNEVDFVLARGRRLVAIEVKSGTKLSTGKGFAAFQKKFGTEAKLIEIGKSGIALERFLVTSADEWLETA